MGYNWRSIIWYEAEGAAYGVHGNSGYLFKFDPKSSKVEIVERITSEPSKKSGMFDQFSYGYLGFLLGPDLRNHVLVEHVELDVFGFAPFDVERRHPG